MTDETPQAPAPRPAAVLPGNLTAAALVLLVFGTLAGLGTVLTVLAALLAGAGRFTMYGNPGMMDGRLVGPWMADGGHGLFMWLLFVGLLAALGATVTGAHVAAGWGILQRRPWARIVGLVVSGTALVLLAVGLAWALVWAAAGTPPGFDDHPRRMADYHQPAMGAMVALGAVITLLAMAAYGFVLWVLARRGDASG